MIWASFRTRSTGTRATYWSSARGGGPDVQGALLAGATHVDAVDIDPVTIRISRRFNSSGVYYDERVTTHIDDARAFFRRATPGYDLVVFGFLDSQALSSSMANIRLDGFVYTAESIRAAYRLVGDQGMLSLAFYISHRPWMLHKLYRMVEEGTGRAPMVYASADTSRVVFIAPKGREVTGPTPITSVNLIDVEPIEFPVATDDWPYLYLAYRTIPSDYLLVIGTLLLLSIVAVLALKPPGIGASHGHFAFLGAGFLLLQTKSIVDASLYFGATWFVTMLVIAGVLLMVMAANWVAIRRRFDAKLLIRSTDRIAAGADPGAQGVDSRAALGRASSMDVTRCPTPHIFRGPRVLDNVQA